MSQNAAALQGWVKSIDPKSGRAFFANHVTRKTQWDPPAGWVEESPTMAPPAAAAAVYGDTVGSNGNEEEPLPSNWEMMTDPSTGKPFYVDHERKITQWTRPTVEKKQAPISHAPAQATTTTSAALARILQSSQAASSYSAFGLGARSYEQEASYFHQSQSHGHDADFSDALPALDFSVKKVGDKYRLECPQCDTLFTLSKRRHHCRLCGDVFCDACSNHRVDLPLPGPEYEKPVRVCDLCFKDVEKGNFFSMRRYITPLQLNDPTAPSGDNDDDDAGAASTANVKAALSGLTQDLNQIVQSAEGFEDKVTIPLDTLIPCITKHLNGRAGTANRAIHALATLLILGSMVGKHDFACAVYEMGKKEVLDQILSILERSGSDRKTLFVQEQAARALFYLTEPQTVASLLKRGGQASSSRTGNDGDDDDDDEGRGTIASLDILRTLKSMLDHSSMTKNIHLQRWSAATIRNLVAEDQRRACMSINEHAGRIASGEPPGKLQYTSLVDQLIGTGGIIILCSLVGSDDSDTRAHATASLGAILASTRAVDESMSALYELSGGRMGSTKKKDGDIIRAISAGGGCGSSVSQLLLSADNAVAKMGCEFLASLVQPLLTDPQGCSTLDQMYDCQKDPSGLGACREAALDLTTSSCLPALLSIVRDVGRTNRPVELRKIAMETLAATVNAIGEMGKAWANGKYEEGMSNASAPSKILQALAALNEEHVCTVALEILKSSSGESLGSNRDTPQSRIRESSGIVLGAMSSCSAEAIMELHGPEVLPTLIVSSNDACMMAPSSLRGDSAPRCVGLLETAASVMMFNWLHPSGASSTLLDRLLETLDVGIMSHLFQVMCAPIEWDSRDKSSGGMKAQAAACRLCCCIFGIAIASNTDIGIRRLMDACDADQSHQSRSRSRQSRGPRNIMEATLTVLQTSLNHGHRMLMGSSNKTLHYQAALLDLVEAALLAVGSMCGSSGAPGGVNDLIATENDLNQNNSDDRFQTRRAEVCRVACDVVVRAGRGGPALLPSMLVGGFGAGVVAGSLRLALAIAHHGSKEQHAKLASSGILVPVSDILRTALSKGELYNFSAALALVKFCGPYVSVGTGGETQAMKNSIAVVTNMLNLPVNPNASAEQMNTQGALKGQCIKTLESLSKNASLWSTISSDALPSIVQYLNGISFHEHGSKEDHEVYCSALRAVKEIVQVPSNAVAAAQSGLATSVGKLLHTLSSVPSLPDGETSTAQHDAIAVLHAMLLNQEARRYCSSGDGNILASVCSVLGAQDGSIEKIGQAAESTKVCLEILHALLQDYKLPNGALELEGDTASHFLFTLVNEPDFLKKLCSTLLNGVDDADSASTTASQTPTESTDLYGAPLVTTTSECCGYRTTGEAASAFFFAACVIASAHESPDAERFWEIVLPNSSDELLSSTDIGAIAYFPLQLLSLIQSAYAPFCQQDQTVQKIEQSLVLYRLLEVLNHLLSKYPKHDLTGEQEFDSAIISMMETFNTPAICLALCKDEALMPLAFRVLSTLMTSIPEDILPLLVEQKRSMLMLVEFLNHDIGHGDEEVQADVQAFLANALGSLTKSGLLKPAVIRHGVKSEVLSGLAAACIRDQSHVSGDDLTSSSLSSGLMHCLVDLCTTAGNGIVLSSFEAEAIARALGKKICHMVISRFLERAKLSQYEIEQNENMMEAPDISMLCAIAQHEIGLKELRSLGGFHALALVAGEGKLMALKALKDGCTFEPELLLEGDTYSSLMNLFSEESRSKDWYSQEEERTQIESTALVLLAELASSSKGKHAVAAAAALPSCVDRALSVVHSVLPRDVSSVPVSASDIGIGHSSDDDHEDAGDGAADDNNGEETATDSETQKTAAASGSELELRLDAGPASATPDTAAIPQEQFDDIMMAAATNFLTAIVVSMPSTRDRLLDDDLFVESCDHLLSRQKLDLHVTEAIVKLVSVLSKRATAETRLSTAKALHLFQTVLAMTFDNFTETTKACDLCKLQSHAVQGVTALYATIPADKMQHLVQTVGKLLTQLIRGQAVPKHTTTGWNEGSGHLAFQITSFYLGLTSRNADLVDATTVKGLVNVVQWRVDPKASLCEGDMLHWDVAAAQSLQVLSMLIGMNVALASSDVVNSQGMLKVVLMIAKPGKAPRRAVDLASALDHLSAKGEPVTRLYARTLQNQLED
eukprot:CAMPEP_0119545386 /NCGR_PEP_ID=MMETSP1352-20130426/137_1 /TAXON_ID=265584 /ORGANISM="Stauroneis constricta, Strain CCMP1120" /LENGTH=2173 /DNA_ID=CAMNT_0007589921 /DNA_START=145 /DNA_END=6666 /DNA_ORIENTATION=+